MKFVSFVRKGRATFGAVVDNGIIDLGGQLLGGVFNLREIIEKNLFGMAEQYVQTRGPELSLSDITLLPVIPDPSKILCIGLNYRKHIIETLRTDCDYPTVFTRFSDSQVAHGQPMMKPACSERFDYEGEMAVIIGKGGRNIAVNNALDHVAGYACYNDGSVRNFQRHTSQFTPGKNFPATGSFGPYLVTPDEVGDYRSLPIQTRLNDKVMQDASLSDLIFPVEELISYCSQFTPLSAGDVIVTGTPGGVGDRRDPPVYMFSGDVVEVEIGCLGTLINPIIDETIL
ncbi:MAG: 5-carboxymethyl-2-hydroxymuconate isomerase [Rhodobacteraceae bacterium]|nr:5-carboxymethyl-2-hydroxymuconate isomerase [Paracoccaceae bacterium]